MKFDHLMVNKVYRSWDAGPMQFLYSERRECRAVTQSNEFWHAQDIVKTAVVLIAVWMPRLAWNDWLQCAAEIANFTAARSPRSRASHRRTGGLQIRYQWTATDTERLGSVELRRIHAMHVWIAYEVVACEVPYTASRKNTAILHYDKFIGTATNLG